MALTQISRIASTTGDTWQTIITGPANVTSLTMSARSLGETRVAVALKKDDPPGIAYIVPGDALREGASARLRLPSIVLEAGDELQVRSSGLVDWIASAVTIS